MDGKIMKCWIRPAEKTGAVGRLPSGKTRPAGHLEHEKRKSGLEKEKRPLSQKQQGRRRMGVFPSAGAVGDQL